VNDLEHVDTGDGVERNFAKLRTLVPDSGGQSVGFRFGKVVCTYAGGTPISGKTTVMHGLGTLRLYSTNALLGEGMRRRIAHSLSACSAPLGDLQARTDDSHAPEMAVGEGAIHDGDGTHDHALIRGGPEHHFLRFLEGAVRDLAARQIEHGRTTDFDPYESLISNLPVLTREIGNPNHLPLTAIALTHRVASHGEIRWTR